MIKKPHIRGVFCLHLFVKKWGWGKLKRWLLTTLQYIFHSAGFFVCWDKIIYKDIMLTKMKEKYDNFIEKIVIFNGQNVARRGGVFNKEKNEKMMRLIILPFGFYFLGSFLGILLYPLYYIPLIILSLKHINDYFGWIRIKS